MTLKSLVKQKEQLSEHQTQIEALVTKTRTELRSLKEMQEKLVALLKEKSLQLQNSQKSLEEMRSNLGQSTKEAEQLDFQIENLDKQLTHFDAQLKGSETKLQLLEGHLTRLRTKSAEYDRLRKEVETRLSEIATLRKTEEDRLRDLEESLVKIITLKKEKKEDLAHATEVVRKARITLAELEIRKSITDELAAEEKALQIIEDLGKEGVIQGILGRLSEFLKVGEQHRKAVEAASAGWMKALIVRDIEVAVKCFEFLRRARLGRIKIIPLKNVSPAKPRPVPEDLPGILGPLASFVESERALRPAINFVFGDTLLANGQRSALLASMKGFRAVTPTGDLYETGGGMEIGYYRVPLDLSSLVPRETAMKELLGAVDSLETLLERGRDDLKRLDEEEARLSEARSTSQNMLRALENEQEMISENLERMKKVSEEMLRRLEVLEKTKREEKFLIDEMSSQKNSIQEKLVALQRSRASLRIRSRSVSLLEVENKHASLEAELNELSRQSVGNESRISTLESSLTTLLPGLEQTRTQLKTIESQIMRLTSQLEACRQQLESLQARCKELQAKRERLAENLANVRARRTEFEDQLKRLEDGLMATLNEIEPVKDEILRFTASIKQKEMESEFHIHELRSLGFQEPIQVPSDEVSSLEPTLSSLKNELDGIGAVNQLAVTQYEDQKNVYMQLSSRISDLEKEKLAIIDFMNELDRKKRDSFMKAFEQVNATLQEIFSAVTGGGKARMVLEFPDDPFKGGVDMFLKFPGRSEMTIASASGGEKSVGTVCFILALQTIHPMPFYIFDEIDAHLDALNSQRLADLLREKAKGSQFIVISLKDTCISRANKVHGVFIQDGVSQVVSLPAVEVGKNGKPQ
jgi:chromosome segregation protein